MSRTGRNPLKGLKETKEKKNVNISFCTIVYIPTKDAYWENSHEVLKLFFNSLFKNTAKPFEVMVLDNGSCKEVREFLTYMQLEGKIDCLIFSRQNLRKLRGMEVLLSIAKGDYVAFADSDVYFLPGWLEKSLEILQEFPKAGRVTAIPIGFGDNTKRSGYEEIKNDTTIKMDTGYLIPKEFIEAHRNSLGEASEKYELRMKDRQDVRITRNGISAYFSGADFQFVINRKALDIILPLKPEKIDSGGDVIYTPILERKLKENGFWMLSTTQYLVHHMGNDIPDLKYELPWIENWASELSNKRPQEQKVTKKNISNSLVKRTLIRNVIKKIHRETYRLLYDN